MDPNQHTRRWKEKCSNWGSSVSIRELGQVRRGRGAVLTKLVQKKMLSLQNNMTRGEAGGGNNL